MDQYQIGLMFRSDWLLEQRVKTELEVMPNAEKAEHQGLVTVLGRTYKYVFTMEKQ